MHIGQLMSENLLGFYRQCSGQKAIVTIAEQVAGLNTVDRILVGLLQLTVLGGTTSPLPEGLSSFFITVSTNLTMLYARPKSKRANGSI